MGRTRSRWGTVICVLGMVMAMLGLANAEEHSKIPLPSYHYGAKIPVECLNRSMCVLPLSTSSFGPPGPGMGYGGWDMR